MVVQGDDLGGLAPFEPIESPVDALPAGRDQIDEQGEIVEPCVALGNQVLLESLEATDRVVEETLDLAEIPRDRKHLAAEAFLDRLTHAVRQCALERLGGGAERLDLLARAAQSRLEPTLFVPTLAGRCDALLRSFQCLFIHAPKATLAVG